MKPGREACELRAEFITNTTGALGDRQLTLLYMDTRPFEVWFDFGDRSGWVIDRGVLHAGLDRPAGIGDVHIQPWAQTDGMTVVSLRSRQGEAQFLIPTAATRNFLTRTFRLVPPDTEANHLDVDLAIAMLLQGAS